VIHCAARPYVTHETESNSMAAYRAVNVAGTRRLVEQLAEFGVKRLVYLSSIKVNGERTALGAPFYPDVSSQSFTNCYEEGKVIAYDNKFKDSVNNYPAPEDPYGLSKWEGEKAIWEVAARTGLEVVIVRPPLVYGPGVSGNLLRLVSMVARGWPLPMGAVNNKRSLMGLANLVDLLIRCIDHPAARGQTLLVSDGQDLSTPQLIRLLAQGMDRPARLFSVSVSLLLAAGSLLGKRAEINRLVDSLQIDSSKSCELLNWNAPVAVEDGIREIAQWYLNKYSSFKY
jgi:nucleoside-diphosphate-sugar epimerase